jgi:FG-GAP repeat
MSVDTEQSLRTVLCLTNLSRLQAAKSLIGAVTIWLLNGLTVSSAAALLVADPNWSVSHVADFNGDGKSDLMWRNTGDGSIVMYLVDGTTITANATLVGLGAWQVAP